MASKKESISKVRIISDTFVAGTPVFAGDIVPNDKVMASEANLRDLVFYKKAKDITGQAEPAGKAGK